MMIAASSGNRNPSRASSRAAMRIRFTYSLRVLYRSITGRWLVMGCIGVRLGSRKGNIGGGKRAQERQRRVLLRVGAERGLHVRQTHAAQGIAVLVAFRDLDDSLG